MQSTTVKDGTSEPEFESIKPVDMIAHELADTVDQLDDLNLDNKSYRPFRSEDSQQHTSHHVVKAAKKYARSSATSTTSVPPEQIKSRVRQAMTKEKKAALHRRLVKGESAIVTKQRRELKQDIKSSQDVDAWFG